MKVELETCPVGGHNMHGKVERKIRHIKESLEKSMHNERLSILQWETLGAEVANTVLSKMVQRSGREKEKMPKLIGERDDFMTCWRKDFTSISQITKETYIFCSLHYFDPIYPIIARSLTVRQPRKPRHC